MPEPLMSAATLSAHLCILAFYVRLVLDLARLRQFINT